MIIGFLGEKRSGKDTCGNYIIENYGFERYAFADPIKRACQHLFGFTDEQCWGDLKEEIDLTCKQLDSFHKLKAELADTTHLNSILLQEKYDSVLKCSKLQAIIDNWYKASNKVTVGPKSAVEGG